MPAKQIRATYTKESGESSERALIVENSGHMMALDVSQMSESERERVVQVYNEWLEHRGEVLKTGCIPFATFAADRGVQVPPPKSFKLAGLAIHG